MHTTVVQTGGVATVRPGLKRLDAALAEFVAAEQGRFGLWLAPAVAAGAGCFLLLRADPPGWSGGLFVLVAGVGVGLVRSSVGRATLAMLLAVGLGFMAGQLAVWRAAAVSELPRRATVASGTVATVEALVEGGRRILLPAARLDGGAVLDRAVRIKLKKGDATPVAPGDEVQVRTLLRPPAPPAYPGAWDLQRDAFFGGIAGYGQGLGVVTVTGGAGGSVLAEARSAIAGRVAASVTDPAQAGIATTLLTGATASIPEADRAAFRDTGLAHLLAIAGLHVGIVMGAVFFCVRLGLAAAVWPALHWPIKSVAAVAALGVAVGYLALTGGHVPVTRSVTMAALVTLAVLAGRRAVTLRGLAVAMAGVALVSPAAVLGVSFQMSFSAVLALIAGHAALGPWMRAIGEGGGVRRLARHVAGLLATSALAGAASAPFAAYHFGEFQLYGVIANLVAVPLTAFWVMPAGMVALLAMPVHLEGPALWVMAAGLRVILLVAHAIAAWPEATFVAPRAPGWSLVAFGLGLAWLCLWRTRVRLAGVPILALGLLGPLWAHSPALLISADARLVGIADGATMAVAGKGDRFTRDAWRAMWGVRDIRAIPETGEAGGMRCDAGACRLGGLSLLRRRAEPADCAAGVLVSAEPMRLSCEGAMPIVIDRFSVWRDGAHAVWTAPTGITVLSDRAARGARPWVPAPPRPRRETTDLPAAAAEELPPMEAQ